MISASSERVKDPPLQCIVLALERKMSVRANREELIQKGILLPDPTINSIPEGILLFATAVVMVVTVKW